MGLKAADWTKLRLDAEAIRDHIQRWLIKQGIDDPFVFVKETEKDFPTSKFTFVAATGISQETVELPTETILGNPNELGLLAQSASEIMLVKLRKVAGKIN